MRYHRIVRMGKTKNGGLTRIDGFKKKGGGKLDKSGKGEE